MSPTDLAIHDIARALCDLQVKDNAQKRAIFVKTLESLVRFAISQREVEQINGVRGDLARVDEILAASRNG